MPIAAIKEWEWGYSQRTCVLLSPHMVLVFLKCIVQLLAIKWQLRVASTIWYPTPESHLTISYTPWQLYTGPGNFDCILQPHWQYTTVYYSYIYQPAYCMVLMFMHMYNMPVGIKSVYSKSLKQIWGMIRHLWVSVASVGGGGGRVMEEVQTLGYSCAGFWGWESYLTQE